MKSKPISAAIAMALALSGAAIIAACTPPKQDPPKPLTGFVSDKTIDLFGYYIPLREIKVGRFRLDHLALGGRDELKKYESGKDRLPTYAPVMLEFSDVSSKQLTNELGQPYFENSPRALPSAYRVSSGTISFVGGDKQVGSVAFTGTLDLAALNAVREATPSDTRSVVLKGDLTIAGKTFKGVTFGWFGGD